MINILLAVVFKFFPLAKAYEIPIRVCVWIVCFLIAAAAVKYVHHSVWTDGYEARSDEVIAERAKALADAIVKDKDQTKAIADVARNFQEDKNEIEKSNPVIRVITRRVRDDSCRPDVSGVPNREIPRRPYGRQPAAGTEIAGIGEAIAADAGNYPLCYAALKQLREAIRAASSAP